MSPQMFHEMVFEWKRHVTLVTGEGFFLGVDGLLVFVHVVLEGEGFTTLVTDVNVATATTRLHLVLHNVCFTPSATWLKQ